MASWLARGSPSGTGGGGPTALPLVHSALGPALPCSGFSLQGSGGGALSVVWHQLVMGPEPCSPWPRPQEPSLNGTKFVQITSAPVTTRLNCLMGTVFFFF